MRFVLPNVAPYRTRDRADQWGKQTNQVGGDHEQDHYCADGDLLPGRSRSAVSLMAGRPENLRGRRRAIAGLHALDRGTTRRMTLAQ